MRHRAALFAVVVAVLPSQALACGMYIPPEKEVLLSDLFDEIDEATVAVADPVEAPSLDAIAEAAELNEAHQAVVDDSRPHRKLVDRLLRRD